MPTIDQLDRKYAVGKPQPSQGGFNLGSLLPNLLGAAGSVAGSLFGPGGKALGGTVGQAGGQAFNLGQQGKNPIMNLPGQVRNAAKFLPGIGGIVAAAEKAGGQPYSGQDFSSIGNQGLQGLLWSQLPGGKMASSVTNPLARVAAQTGIRATGGAAVGAGTQALQNEQQGQPIGQNVAQSGLESGAINAVIPGVSKVLSTGVKAAVGTPKGIYDRIAEFMVGSGQDVNPDVRNSLVFQDARDPQTGDIIHGGHYWQQSIKNLAEKAQEVYAPLQEQLGKIQSTVGDFYKTFTNNGERIFDTKETKAVNNALLQAADAAQTPESKDALLQLRGILNSQMGIDPLKTPIAQAPIGMDTINEFKKNIPYNEDTKDLYKSVQKFVEQQVGKDTPTGQINQRYNNLKIAIDNITNRFADKPKQQLMESGMGWMQRIAMVIGSGIVGTAVGLPSGSMYAGPTVGGGAYVASALKDAMMKTPQRADNYAKVLQPAGQAGSALLQLLQQATPRLPGMTQ